jgi:SAM-dependent methyltransferase
MSSVFLDYSKYYDLLYKDKNYNSEVEFIIKLIKKFHPGAKTILNLGCGTGEHDKFLTEAGYSVTGIDLSEEMLSIAKKKNPRCNYYVADAREFFVDKKFDAVVSLFHVLSYQASNTDVFNFLGTISNHLEVNGIAIFDYWYGPAVLNLKPEKRTKKFESNDLLITRHANTDLNYRTNIATVNFDINVQDKNNNSSIEMHEKHPMRYFFSPELELFFSQFNFKQLAHFSWPSLDTPPSENSWASYSVVKK